MIQIPHRTQLGMGVANLCAQTSIAMLTDYYYGTQTTARDVAIRTHTYDGSFSTAAELTQMATAYGLKLTYRRPAAAAWWRDALERGVTAICLLHYGKLTGTAQDYAHFCVPVHWDVEDEMVYVQDPLKLTGPSPIPAPRFIEAIGTPTPGNTYTHQAWIAEAVNVSTGGNVTKRGMGWWVSLSNTTAGALEEFVQMCEQTKPAALTLVNDHGDDKFAYMALDIQRRLTSTRIVYRRTVTHHDQTADNTQDVITPERWVQMHLMFSNTPVFCAVNNEPRQDPSNLADIDRTVQWHIRVAQLARAAGIRTSHVGFSAGSPHESLYARWDPLLRYMAAHPGWFQIDVHEYIRALWCHELAAGAKQPSQWPTAPNTRPLWLLGRYRRWIDRCREIGVECPPIFISEWGWDATGAIPPQVYGDTKGLPSCLPVWETWGVGDAQLYGAAQLQAAWRVLYQQEPKAVGTCFFMYTDHPDYWKGFNAYPSKKFVEATQRGFDTMVSTEAAFTPYAAGHYTFDDDDAYNVRATASLSGTVVGQLKTGAIVEILPDAPVQNVGENRVYWWQRVRFQWNGVVVTGWFAASLEPALTPYTPPAVDKDALLGRINVLADEIKGVALELRNA